MSIELAPYRRLEAQLVVVFALILVVAVAAGLVIANNIVKPVRRLAVDANRIGEGNYGVEIDIVSDDEFGKLAHALNTMQFEIAEREHRIVHQAHHDDLTGLPNRYLAKDRIGGAINRSTRSGDPFTVVMLDLARFKQINDSLGHHIGDVVLKETARRLSSCLRRSDVAARFGGDDFLLVLEDTNSDIAISLIEDQIRNVIEQPIALDGMQVSLDFRFGITEYPAHADNASALLRRAEIAMYGAKDSHTRIQLYEVGRDEDHLRQLAIVSDLDEAMAAGQLALHYQPKVCLHSGEVTNAEALVRWVHPKFGFLPPDEFITVLEQTGNIEKLTNWVVGEATTQCRRWLDDGLDVVLSINLSALDLLNPELVEIVNAAVHRNQLEPSQLVLEITESAIMMDPERAGEMLDQLRLAGYALSIDDFGTGYSSLSQLKRLPVGELKIDKSFVMKLHADNQDAVIVRSTIAMAQSMGLAVVAEGVESEASVDMLREYGCDKGQGYLFSKPLPADEFSEWCHRSENKFHRKTSKVA